MSKNLWTDEQARQYVAVFGTTDAQWGRCVACGDDELVNLRPSGEHVCAACVGTWEGES